MKKERIVAEEKSIYGIGRVDEGNWFTGQFTGNKGKSWGTLEMPLNFLPSALQRRAEKGQPIYLRLNISDDGERRVAQPDKGAMTYTE